MSNIGIALTVVGIIAMIGAYFLYKNTPKAVNQHKIHSPSLK